MIAARAVLLDLDGTLVDTPSAILAGFRAACSPHGAVPLPDDARSLIGRPLDDIFPVLLPGLGPAVWEEAKSVFRAAFAQHTLSVAESLVFPGVPALLEDLAAGGASLAVVTSKVTASARELLDASGLSPLVGLVVGHDQAERGKPAPDPALLAASLLGLRPDECVVVGDSTDDVAMAVAAGAPAIGVTWGVGGREALREAGAAAVADTVSDLVTLLRDLTPTTAKEATR